MKKEIITLKNGHTIEGTAFDDNDFIKLQGLFKIWQQLNTMVKELGGRNQNIPDVLSEGLFAYFFDAVRTNNSPGAGSYDCVLRKTGEGVQVKSASVPQDLSSFGPVSAWDVLYFADFAPNDKVDGNVYFYKIDSDEIPNLVLNQRTGETFADQQHAGRRPRFSIKKTLIIPRQLQPEKKVNLLTGVVSE